MSTIPCTVEQFNQAFCEFHKEIEMMKNPKNKQQWIQNVFAGDPPTGYASWRDWIDSSEKRGAFIRKAEFEDWSGIIKPAEPEWDGKGLPPVGEEVEASFVSGSMDQYWSKGKVIAHDNGLPVVRVGGIYYGLNLDRLRPLRTKEQREREELIEILQGNWLNSDMDQLADAVIKFFKERYNLEPKQ